MGNFAVHTAIIVLIERLVYRMVELSLHKFTVTAISQHTHPVLSPYPMRAVATMRREKALASSEILTQMFVPPDRLSRSAVIYFFTLSQNSMPWLRDFGVLYFKVLKVLFVPD